MLVGFLFYAQNDTSTIGDRPDASQIHEIFILWEVQEKKTGLQINSLWMCWVLQLRPYALLRDHQLSMSYFSNDQNDVHNNSKSHFLMH